MRVCYWDIIIDSYEFVAIITLLSKIGEVS